MPSRAGPSAGLLAGLLLFGTALAGCGDAATPSRAIPNDVGTVHLPTATAATTDSSGHQVEPLPVRPVAPMSSDRIRGQEYSYSLPVAWTEGGGDSETGPDTVILPDDSDVPALIAVQRPFAAGGHTLAEVVDRLRADFAAKGLTPKAAAERDVAGYRAQGIVVDEAPDLRHVYYVVVYTDTVFAVRLSYDPASPDALGVFRGVLDSWTWG